MSNSTPTDTQELPTTRVQVGEWMHFLATRSVALSVNVYSVPAVVGFGSEIQITQAILDASLDRTGASWLDLADNDEAQIEKFGRVQFRSGRWPIGQSRIEPGSAEWHEQREAERARAWAESTSDTERAIALRSVRERFGPAPTLNRVLRTVKEKRGEL
jgi:hypothetical protein